MPDEVARRLPRRLTRRTRRHAPDLLALAYEYRARFGTWPATWADFVQGGAAIARLGAQDRLSLAYSFAAPQSHGWRTWEAEQVALARGHEEAS